MSVCALEAVVSRSSPFVIVLSDADRAVLEERVRAYTAPHAEVTRAKIVLMAAERHPNTVIAGRLGVHVDVVSRWRKRFVDQGVDGLTDRERRGRPRSFSPQVVAEVKAMACEPPERRGAPLSRWSSAELAAQARPRGWSRRCRRRLCAAGCVPTRSNPGSTDRGSSRGILTSQPRPAGCLTCTPGCGMESTSVRTTT